MEECIRGTEQTQVLHCVPSLHSAECSFCKVNAASANTAQQMVLRVRDVSNPLPPQALPAAFVPKSKGVDGGDGGEALGGVDGVALGRREAWTWLGCDKCPRVTGWEWKG